MFEMLGESLRYFQSIHLSRWFSDIYWVDLIIYSAAISEVFIE